MKKKYIIELEDENVLTYAMSERLAINTRLGDAKGYLNTMIPLAPYTAPDLEQVRKEAYEKGYENGFIAGHLKAEKSGQKFYEDGYQRGLADAWEAARKIAVNADYGGLPAEALREIFSVGTASIAHIFDDFSAAEAIEKIRQYEQEKEEQKEEKPIPVEDVMRQYLDTFCKHNFCTKCILHTPDFTCGRGYHFLTKNPVPDEEVRRAYVEVFAKMKE